MNKWEDLKKYIVITRCLKISNTWSSKKILKFTGIRNSIHSKLKVHLLKPRCSSKKEKSNSCRSLTLKKKLSSSLLINTEMILKKSRSSQTFNTQKNLLMTLSTLDLILMSLSILSRCSTIEKPFSINQRLITLTFKTWKQSSFLSSNFSLLLQIENIASRNGKPNHS